MLSIAQGRSESASGGGRRDLGGRRASSAAQLGIASSPEA